jgi:hypothetical protein
MISERRYLYAIVDGAEPLTAPLMGLGDAPVSLLVCRDIAAAISPVDAGQLEPVTERLLCHETVVETLMEQRSTLPVRFGTIFSHPDRVLEVLNQRHAGFKADLARVAGQVEIGLRLLWDVEAVRGAYQPAHTAPHIAADGAGARYLRERLASTALERHLHAQAELLDAWCRECLGPTTSDIHIRLLATEKMPVSAAFLVRRERLDDVLSVVRRMSSERLDLDVICTGVWPPYHFVSSTD